MDAGALLNIMSQYGLTDVKFNEPMKNHATWRIGGPADIFIRPHSVEEVQQAVRVARELQMPYTVIGRGSNLLVLDGGIRGIVIQLHDNLADIAIDGNRLLAQAGRSLVSAANISLKHDLLGMEFATGIPGSVGGAVMMNAGAHGGEVKDVLEFVDVVDETGALRRYSNADLKFKYRYSLLKDRKMIAVNAVFLLAKGDGQEAIAKVKEWSTRRATTQPLSMPNCGSVFRNPEGTHAGYLIETAGLKGLRRGDAQISEKHANFIVNLGSASASDVLSLMRHVQETVRDRYAIELETEVRMIGEPASGR
jgi:UDP-N-acetylmuramate dehydrogenase